MKIKLIVSSFLTIALCLSLIAGSTFALFTSESKANVAVTSAKVKVTASLENDSIIENFGDTDATDARISESDPSKINVVNFAPKDSISVALKLANESTIAIKYRLSVICSNDFDGALKVTSSPITIDAWNSAKAGQTLGKDGIVNINIEYLYVGGENLQEIKNAEFTFVIEAVQANGVLERVENYEQLKEVLSNNNATDNHPVTVMLDKDIVVAEPMSVVGKFVIDTNGKSISTATQEEISTVKFPFVMTDKSSLTINTLEGVTHSIGYLGLVEIPQNVSADVTLNGGNFVGTNNSSEEGALVTVRDNSSKEGNNVNVNMIFLTLSAKGIKGFSSQGIVKTSAVLNVERSTFITDTIGILADSCKLHIEDTRFETADTAIKVVKTRFATMERGEIIIDKAANADTAAGIAVDNGAKIDVKHISVNVPSKVPAYKVCEAGGQINATSSFANGDTVTKIDNDKGIIIIDNVTHAKPVEQ